MENLLEKRKNQFLAWSQFKDCHVERTNAYTNKAGVPVTWEVSHLNFDPQQIGSAEELAYYQCDLIRSATNVVVLKTNWLASEFHNYYLLRVKTKGHERARYDFLREQISEKLVSLDSRPSVLPPATTPYSLEETNSRPTKYIPSDELVSIVRTSIWRRQEELKSMFQDDMVVLDEDSAALHFMYERNPSTESVEGIGTFISDSVRGFLATIGQGMAYGDGELTILSKNGELLEVVLAGFKHRIPVMLKDAGIFSTQLYKDLVQAAQNNLLKSEFGELKIKDSELVLQRLKTVIPASERVGRRDRAAIARLG